MKPSYRLFILAASLFLLVRASGALTAALPDGTRAVSAVGDDEKYPYLGDRFISLVRESFENRLSGDGSIFFAWMEKACRRSGISLPGKEGLSLSEVLRREKLELKAIRLLSARVRTEIALSSWLHKMVKKAIPLFSLDRGFEFCNVVNCGERQCFLQSFLLAGLLQEIGVSAGVVMVYRNISGDYTNNGHAVTLVRLSDCRDIILDASEPEPFARHRGLFARLDDYCFLEPNYKENSDLILSYRRASGPEKIDPSGVRTLDFEFIDSQFWYYRGERAPGGILSKKMTVKGLEKSEAALKKSVGLNSRNPLAVFMLGRVLRALGKTGEARKYFGEAFNLYSRYGWIPEGPRDFYNSSR